MIEPVRARVSVDPENIARRRISHWGGLSGETVQFTGNAPFGYQFQSPLHLLVVCHRAVRRDGETSIDGLAPSARRSYGGTMTLVPAGRSFSGSFIPRVLPRSSYFYIDPRRVPVDPNIGFLTIEIAPRLFFQDAPLWQTALKLCDLVENPFGGSRLYADALASVLAIELVRLQNGSPPYAPQVQGGLAARQERIIREYIEEHVAGDISLTELSQLVRLSPTHFSRAFKSSFGTPPHRYQLQRRIELAKVLLADPQPSLMQVAMACGFTFQSNFATAFRRVTGMTPSGYRRAIT